MGDGSFRNWFSLGLLICIGLSVLGYTLGSSAIRFKEYERVVTVKGLSEREVPADIAIWPIQFTRASNDLAMLYAQIEADTGDIRAFLNSAGFEDAEITVSSPAITDKLAQAYESNARIEFRFAGTQTMTVYSHKVDAVRKAANRLAELGKKGIAFSGEGYENKTEYLYTKLNEVKPAMIEEATQKAREVAVKFAQDSSSRLGKIRSANQGQFSIEDRDRNTPYVKKVRVVSTVEYYLSD
jgi:hypothetical protein